MSDLNYTMKLFNNTSEPNSFMWNTLTKALAGTKIESPSKKSCSPSGEDRINDLSASILVHILSSLNTIEAVRTSVLFKMEKLMEVHIPFEPRQGRHSQQPSLRGFGLLGSKLSIN
ncbi:hypothetical protein Sjap_002850 [Stephania japonica]|uniref:Uncharacterized protein n=1 Tax=Stephania japonica TaxID=461633 RepID=A0AAP0KQ94_9MAGN